MWQRVRTLRRSRVCWTSIRGFSGDLGGLNAASMGSEAILEKYGKFENVRELGFLAHKVRLETGMRMPLDVFHKALEQCKDLGRVHDVIPILGIMMRSGVEPDMRIFELGMQCAIEANNKEVEKKVLRELQNEGFHPNLQIYRMWVKRAVEVYDSEEVSLNLIQKMQAAGVSPTIDVYVKVLQLLDKKHKIGSIITTFYEMDAKKMRVNQACRDVAASVLEWAEDIMVADAEYLKGIINREE